MTAVSRVPESPQLGYEGRAFGGFRLIREIACGGMATVYLGQKVQHAGIRQLAAVKVIHPHLARDADFVDMFLDEARIVSCIDHPNVCGVLDVGKSDGTYYLAMDYVMGETWAEVIARLSASPEAETMIVPIVAQIIAQACEGLHAAHEAKDAHGNPLHIVHRDVSPQNIMVGYDGSVRVLDFGIASAAERLHTTRNGAIKGRLSYMAPEQMRGLPVTRRADVWSLGVILWEALARDRLFRRDNEAKTMLAVTFDPLPSLPSSGYAVPASVRGIVTRALQRDSEARYPSARELGLALSRCAAKELEPIGVPEVSAWMRRLFAEEIDLKSALLREAAQGMGGQAPSRVMSSVSGGSNSDDRRTRPAKRSAVSTSPVSSVRPILRKKAARTNTLLLAGAGLLLAASLSLLLAPQTGEPGAQLKREVTASYAQPTPGIAAPDANLTGTIQPDLTFAKEADLTFALEDIESLQEEVARPPERATRPSKIGVVSITTSGAWAEVYLDTRKLGTTPMRLSLPAGSHSLRFRRFGKGQDIVRNVTVENGKAIRVTVPME